MKPSFRAVLLSLLILGIGLMIAGTLKSRRQSSDLAILPPIKKVAVAPAERIANRNSDWRAVPASAPKAASKELPQWFKEMSPDQQERIRKSGDPTLPLNSVTVQ